MILKTCHFTKKNPIRPTSYADMSCQAKSKRHRLTTCVVSFLFHLVGYILLSGFQMIKQTKAGVSLLFVCFNTLPCYTLKTKGLFNIY